MASGFKIADIHADLSVDSKNLERGLANGRQALQAIAREIATVREASKGATPSIARADAVARLRELRAEMKALSADMQSAYSRVGVANGGLNLLAGGMAKGKASTLNFGYALTQLGSIIDDAQYGFQGVVNNIGPLALGLSGGNMSVAAGAQIAAVAIAQLIRHWDDLKSAMGFSIIRNEADEMDRLAKKTRLAADEEEHFQNVKRREAETKRREGSRPPLEEEATKRAQAAIDEADRDAVVKGLRQTREGQLKIKAALKFKDFAEVEEKVKKGEAVFNQRRSVPQFDILGNIKGYAEETDKEMEDRKRRTLQDRANYESMLKQAAEDMLSEETLNQKGQREALTHIIRENPDAFGPGADKLATMLGRATPEQVKKDKIEAQNNEVQQKINDLLNEEARGIANQLQHSGAKPTSTRQMALAGHADLAAVQADMERAGSSKEEIKQLAPKVLALLVKDVEDEVRDYALKHGKTNADARKDMMELEQSKRALAMQAGADRVREAKERVADMEEQIRRKRREHQTPAMEDTASLAKKMAVAGLRTDNYRRDMLKAQRELKEATQNVERAVKEQDLRARAAE